MTPEELTEKLKEVLGDNLQTVVLYGSAASVDFIEKKSDFNILLIASDWTLEALQALRPIVQQWVKRGNPTPLCFTPKRFEESADVFPLEIIDIQQSHRVLYGELPVDQMPINRKNLRHQVEYELRSNLLKLRDAYLAIPSVGKGLAMVMVESLSSFLVLFKACLRFYEDTIPESKMEAARELCRKFGIDPAPLEMIHQLKSGDVKASELDTEKLFQQYLRTVEAVLDRIDAESKH